MAAALLLHLFQWVSAFLALDRCFRHIPVEPATLRGQIRLYRRRYAAAAVAFCVGGGLLQFLALRPWGAALALVGPLPWWLLWRFGWRKQFTHLYKYD